MAMKVNTPFDLDVAHCSGWVPTFQKNLWPYSIFIKIDALSPVEAITNIKHNARCHIPEDTDLHDVIPQMILIFRVTGVRK
jgi:hypothetical protein